MSTFEGSMMAIRTVNSLSHYTEWTVAHVHSGALGWVAMISFGSIYYMIPRLWGRDQMYKKSLVELHFWLATIGIVLYIASMWIAGVMEGLMWRSIEADGTLTYSFVQALASKKILLSMRLIGGGLFLTGIVIMLFNTLATVIGRTGVNPPVPAPSHGKPAPVVAAETNA